MPNQTCGRRVFGDIFAHNNTGDESQSRGCACGKGGKQVAAFEDDSQADSNHNKCYAADAEDEA